ncbi:MAG: transposase [Deltaproteobacteria bacterium]|nr:transposase [Deltaproteobacteria bacterium]
MPLKQKQTKTTRRRYSPEFKSEALSLAEQVEVADAAKQLGLHESRLHAWRKKAWYEASRRWYSLNSPRLKGTKPKIRKTTPSAPNPPII